LRQCEPSSAQGADESVASIKEMQGRRTVAQSQTKLLYPGLAGFYETMLPIAGALVRIVVGIMFLMHVSTKFKLGADAVAVNVFAKNGI
jgi:hypothetical protein